VAILKFMVNFR